MDAHHPRAATSAEAHGDGAGDLVSAWRASGWTARRTWLLYLEVGGGEPFEEVRRRLHGVLDWRGSDELALIVAVNEALRRRGMPAMARHRFLERSRCSHDALPQAGAPSAAAR